MKHIKKISTMIVLICIFIFTTVYMNYTDYKNTFIQKNTCDETYQKENYILLNTIYSALKVNAQTKADKVKDSIRSNLINTYSSNWNKYSLDFDKLIEQNNPISSICNKYIADPNLRYLNNVKSDANDMFVANAAGIISDASQDCSASGYSRTWNVEISKHFNQVLAKTAINTIISNTSSNSIFWNFKNTNQLKTPKYTVMDINKVLNTPNINDLKDLEFLTVSYIDEYKDITGLSDINEIGHKNNNRKLYVVQGFNICEQINANQTYKESFDKLNTIYQDNLISIQNSQNIILLRFTFSLMLFIISFLALSILQISIVTNAHVKGIDLNEGDDTRFS